MSDSPGVKRAIAFFDGQTLFAAARDAFGFKPLPMAYLVSLKPLRWSAAGI